MSKIVKRDSEIVSEELVASLVGKFVHAPTNKHIFKRTAADGKKYDEKVNAWFAGYVVGYAKEYLKYDFEADKETEEVSVIYTVLLSDGMAYQLSNESDVVEITESEFAELLGKHTANIVTEEVSKDLLLPSQEKKIILPGDVR